MDRKKILRIVGIISLIIISGLLFLFIILPMMVLPPYPASLFMIANHDDFNHTVRVEIFDSENNSIFIESFDVKPDDLFSYDRGLDWCPNNTFYWLFWDEGYYTFEVTLDDSINASHSTELYPSKSVWIAIGLDDRNPLQIWDTYRD